MICAVEERPCVSAPLKLGSGCDDTDSTSLPRAGLSPDHNLDVLVERRQQVHQAFHGEARELVVTKRRYLRLRHSQRLGGVGLGEIASNRPSDDRSLFQSPFRICDRRDLRGPRSRAIMLALVAFEGLTPPQLDATAEETMSPIARRPMPSSLPTAD